MRGCRILLSFRRCVPSCQLRAVSFRILQSNFERHLSISAAGTSGPPDFSCRSEWLRGRRKASAEIYFEFRWNALSLSRLEKKSAVRYIKNTRTQATSNFCKGRKMNPKALWIWPGNAFYMQNSYAGFRHDFKMEKMQS